MSCPGTSLGLGRHPSPTSSRHSCRFLHVPPYALGEGWHRSLLQAPGWRWMGVWWEGNAWHTPVSRPSCRLHKCAASGWRSGSRPRPLPGPTARAYPRPGAGAWGRGGEAAGASLQCIILWPGQRGAGRLATLCARRPALCAPAPPPASAALRWLRARAPGPLPARGGQGVWCGRHE